MPSAGKTLRVMPTACMKVCTPARTFDTTLLSFLRTSSLCVQRVPFCGLMMNVLVRVMQILCFIIVHT